MYVTTCPRGGHPQQLQHAAALPLLATSCCNQTPVMHAPVANPPAFVAALPLRPLRPTPRASARMCAAQNPRVRAARLPDVVVVAETREARRTRKAAEKAAKKAETPEARAARKAAKRAARAAETDEERAVRKAAKRAAKMAALEEDGVRACVPEEGGGAVGVSVCGGKACLREGAAAVAERIGADVRADAVCQGLCGGGATVVVGGLFVKVPANGAS